MPFTFLIFSLREEQAFNFFPVATVFFRVNGLHTFSNVNIAKPFQNNLTGLMHI